MKKRLKVWIAASLAALAAGATTIVYTLRCSDARAIIKKLKAIDSPHLLSFYYMIPKECGIEPESDCSRLSNNTVCRYGLMYGPGIGGNIKCNVKDGKLIPCVSGDGMYANGEFDPNNLDYESTLNVIKQAFFGDEESLDELKSLEENK